LKKVIPYAGIVVILIIIGFQIKPITGSPDNALLFFNDETKEYYAPPCLMEIGYNDIESIYNFGRLNNIRVAIHKDVVSPYKPNVECRDNSGFFQEERSLSGMLLEKIGLFSKTKSRWNPDGSWNF
jgi:hypothetical protein